MILHIRCLLFCPQVYLGLVSASLLAAFMSTMSTQLNLELVILLMTFIIDFFDREPQIKSSAVARISTVFTIILGSGLGLLLTSAGQAFNMLLMIVPELASIYP